MGKESVKAERSMETRKKSGFWKRENLHDGIEKGEFGKLKR